LWDIVHRCDEACSFNVSLGTVGLSVAELLMYPKAVVLAAASLDALGVGVALIWLWSSVV